MKLQALNGCLAASVLLAMVSCAPVSMKRMDVTQDDDFGLIRESVHRTGDDLLTAGLGVEGLRSLIPPAIDIPAAPTAAELRRRAVWSNWRGIADLRPGGGAGDELPAIPGREFTALARVPGATHPHRVLLQLPDHFNPLKPCLVVAPASGSRGVYGAIAVAGPWALPRGCAVVFTDKGAGTDYVDLAVGQSAGLDGRLATGDESSAFVPDTATTAGIAFKHAHSRDNPEADWGLHVRQAVTFGLRVLSQSYPNHPPFTAATTRVIAVGLSNGGGAVLRAAEHQDELIDAVVAGEPNIFVDAKGGRALYDYATLAALLLPCALLDLNDLPEPPLSDTIQKLGLQRCASLRTRGQLEGNTTARQAKDARAQLHAAGFDDRALHSGTISSGFDLWRAVAVTYSSSYGRFPIGAHPCGFDFALLDENSVQRPSNIDERSLWWSDASGIPPGNGIVMRDPNRSGEDPDLAELVCLRDLWVGDSEAAKRVREGVAQTHAAPPRAGLPVLIVHGLDDGLIPVAFSSAPYVAMAQEAGRTVEFWPVQDAQHFDAFLAFPNYGQRYVPLLPAIHAGLDAVWATLEYGTPLPASPPATR